MINFGTKEDDEITHLTHLPFVQCKKCQKLTGLDIYLRLGYFFIFWIPFFPTKNIFSICSNCKHVLGAEAFTPEMKRAYKEANVSISVPWWYWSGLILVVLSILFSFLFR
jgi:hypothetical protein